MQPVYRVLINEKNEQRARNKRIALKLKPFNVSVMQYVMLGIVRDNSNIRVTDIAKTLETSLAFVTTTLNTLEARGFVSRSTHKQDNRAKTVQYIGGDLLDNIEDVL